MVEGIRFERVRWGELRYKSNSKPQNPILSAAMSLVHGLRNTASLLINGGFGERVVYNPALFPGSIGEGDVITRNFLDGTLTINEQHKRDLLIIPARLVHSFTHPSGRLRKNPNLFSIDALVVGTQLYLYHRNARDFYCEAGASLIF